MARLAHAEDLERTFADDASDSGARLLPQRGGPRTEDDPPALGTLRCPTCGREHPADFAVCPRDATPLRRDQAETDPLIGCVLASTYRMLRVLGKGGMGRLYEAEHARIGRRFAVKVLHEAHADKREAVRRFEREADALSRIKSDHVLDVIDVLAAPDGRTTIVTSLLEGEDLQRRLDRCGRLPVGETIALGRMICRGLAAAHAVGVVHRDLKPSNLFLTAGPDGRTTLKILDFGVAKLSDDGEVTKHGVVLGTPAYMAPEQARGSHDADERSDLYAVGAVLYRMITGKMPYEGADAAETLSKLLHSPPPRPRALRRDIPVALESVIQMVMSRAPDERPRSALELEALLSAAEVEGGSSLGSGPGQGAGALGAGGVPRRTQGRAQEESTLLLPRGAVAQAADIEKRARRARPVAVSLVTGGAVFTAALGASLLRPLADLAAPDVAAALSSALGIVGTFAGAAAFLYRGRAELAERWSSAPEIDAWNRRVGRALGFGTLALGAGAVPALLAGALTEGGVSLAPLPVAALALAAGVTVELTLRARAARA